MQTPSSPPASPIPAWSIETPQYMARRPPGGSPRHVAFIDLTQAEDELTPRRRLRQASMEMAEEMQQVQRTLWPTPTPAFQLPLRCADCYAVIQPEDAGRECRSCEEYRRIQADFLNYNQMESNEDWYQCEICNQFHHPTYLNIGPCVRSPRLVNLPINYARAIEPIEEVPEEDYEVAEATRFSNEYFNNTDWNFAHADHNQDGLRLIADIISEMETEEQTRARTRELMDFSNLYRQN